MYRNGRRSPSPVGLERRAGKQRGESCRRYVHILRRAMRRGVLCTLLQCLLFSCILEVVVVNLLPVVTKKPTLLAEAFVELLLLTGIVVSSLVFFFIVPVRQDEAAAQVEAKTDALTGAYNRHYLASLRDTLVHEARSSERPVTLFMADIDHFKKINDKYGHIAGDAVLAATVNRFKAVLRLQDLVVRYGGEEFLVVVKELDCESPETVAERLLAATQSVHVAGIDETISISIGIASWVPEAACTFADFVKAADAALYRAKRNGRGRCESAIPEVELVAGCYDKGIADKVAVLG